MDIMMELILTTKEKLKRVSFQFCCCFGFGFEPYDLFV